jgi:hypothetical protein
MHVPVLAELSVAPSSCPRDDPCRPGGTAASVHGGKCWCSDAGADVCCGTDGARSLRRKQIVAADNYAEFQPAFSQAGRMWALVDGTWQEPRRL